MLTALILAAQDIDDNDGFSVDGNELELVLIVLAIVALCVLIYHFWPRR